VGKIAEEIEKLQQKESLTLPELFEKYPHLASLQFQEMKEENSLNEAGGDKRKLLLD
jgi:hypothetical protein